jgi:hypothetical protein
MNHRVNIEDMFDIVSLSTEDDSGSNSDGDSNDSDVDIDDAESNSSNENSALDGSDDDIDEIMQQDENDEEVGWETTSETED